MINFKNNYRRNRFKSNGDKNFRKRNGNGHKISSDFNNSLDFKRKNPGRNNQNASKLIDKYNDLAREALSNGDKILSENYLQHADHFSRILKSREVSKEINSSNTAKINSENKENDKSNTEEIAELTFKCLIDNVPSEVPGIAFLSGGQTEIEATRNLNAINKINNSNFAITFSYGRALQKSTLSYWGKNREDISNTQKVFNHRAKMNSLSASGQWTEDNDKINI